MVNTESQIGTAISCSIVLTADSDLTKFSKYLPYLSWPKLPAEYELIIVNAVCQTESDRSNVKRVFSHSSLVTKELRRNTYGQNLSVLRPFSI